jgi:hypothetical protein
MHKESFIINRNTFLHVSTLLGHLQGERFVIVTLMLHLQLSENVLLTVYCVVFGGVNSLWSGPGPRRVLHEEDPAGSKRVGESSRPQKQRSTQSTAHSHSTVKCNPSVKVTKKFSLKMTQQGRNM